MLSFFNKCLSSQNSKIKPGQLALQIYDVKQNPNKQLHRSGPEKIPILQQSKTSFKYSVQSGSNEPLQVIQYNPKKHPDSLESVSQAQNLKVMTVQKSSYSLLVQDLKKNNKKYTDPDFSPQNKSLGPDPVLHNFIQKWVRATQLFSKQSLFFEDNVNPSDVIQGYYHGVGNCYFMAAVAALARTPSRIKNIFLRTQLSEEGIYCVRLFHRGVYKEVIVDDYIPISNGGPVFARPPKGSSQIWVLILEKCFAKICGGYKNMNGGLPSEVYYTLTGAPTFFYTIAQNRQKHEIFWQKVLSAFQKNFCLDAGTPSKVDRSKWLRPNHAYSIIGVYQVQNHKLVKLRNPAGQQWAGRAADFDKQFWDTITSEEKEAIGYQNENNSIFFMLWQDFVQSFGIFQICEYKDNAKVLSIRTTFTMKNAEVFQLQTQGGQVIISLVEDIKRSQGISMKTFKYSSSYIIVSKLIKNQKGQQDFKLIRVGKKSNFAEHHQKLNLEAGTYVIYAKYEWTDKKDQQATFVAYTDKFIKLRQAKQIQFPNFLNKSFLSIPKDSLEYLDPQQQFVIAKSQKGLQGGYGYYAAKLDSKAKSKVALEIDEKQLKKKNLILKKPYKGKGNVKIVLNPGQEILVLIRSKDAVVLPNLQIPDPKITRLV